MSPTTTEADDTPPSYAERTERLNAIAAFLAASTPAADRESYLSDPDGDAVEARDSSRSDAFEAAGRTARES